MGAARKEEPKQKRIDRTKVSAELEMIRERSKAKLLTPRDTWQAAKNPKSAMHHWFTWDTQEACEKLWDIEARALIRSITIEYEARVVQAYVHLTVDEVGYTPIQKVMENTISRLQYIKQLETEYMALWRKYEEISELAPAFEAFGRAIRAAKDKEAKQS